MKKEIKIIDYLWVLQAFLRGKILRQKAYRPQGNIFHTIPGGSIERMLILIRWWGYRPMTAEEWVQSMKEGEYRGDRVPDVFCTDDKVVLGLSQNNSPYRWLRRIIPSAILVRKPKS